MIRLKLDNVIVAGLAFTAFLIFIFNLPEIRAFLETLDSIGGHASEKEKFQGFIAVGFLGICLVAMVRILVNSKEK